MTFGGGFDAILGVGRKKSERKGTGWGGVGRRADSKFQDFPAKEKVRDVWGDKVKSRSYEDKGFSPVFGKMKEDFGCIGPTSGTQANAGPRLCQAVRTRWQ